MLYTNLSKRCPTYSQLVNSELYFLDNEKIRNAMDVILSSEEK